MKLREKLDKETDIDVSSKIWSGWIDDEGRDSWIPNNRKRGKHRGLE